VHIEGDDEILPHLAKLVGVRFSDNEDPELAGRVASLHQAKVAKYPAWGKRLEALSGGPTAAGD
jgi:hypothetical protein